ncbi:UNVERIFIED_CONTAM: hypothetical protein RMT77_009958 [Armadillidium vulgare]
MEHKDIYAKTPLLESITLSKLCGIPAYMKMDNVQPSGSYKIRGISNFVLNMKKYGVKRIVSASGGNAGMATAYTGKLLQIPTTVVIPESTPKLMVAKLEDQKAFVQISGRNWNEAQEKALKIAEDSETEYVHPFHHPLIWKGIEPIVDEILEQCPLPVSAIVLSVGGGGLLCGVLQGLIKLGLKIPVIAMETQGAHCFNAALKAGKPVSIGEITSIAKTLGALSVTPRVFDLLPESNVISKVASDKEAIYACERFIDDERCLVEPSCAVSLSAAYSNIISDLVAEGKIKKDGAVVFIVCGGNGITIKQLEEWKKIVG